MNSAKRNLIQREKRINQLVEGIFWVVMIPAGLFVSIGLLFMTQILFTV
jgi:hypothetical protein